MRPADIQRLEAELSDPLTTSARAREIASQMMTGLLRLHNEFDAYREHASRRLSELEARLENAERIATATSLTKSAAMAIAARRWGTRARVWVDSAGRCCVGQQHGRHQHRIPMGAGETWDDALLRAGLIASRPSTTRREGAA